MEHISKRFGSFYANKDITLTVAIELEGHCYSRLRSSDDFREGVEAFHGKRNPNFIGS